jgi:hypothetical protein
MRQHLTNIDFMPPTIGTLRTDGKLNETGWSELCMPAWPRV